MRKLSFAAILLALMLLFTACAAAPAAGTETRTTAETAAAAEEASEPGAAETVLETMEADAAGSSDLVVYFSWSGNTRQVAEAIQSQTGADIFELVPVSAYPETYDETLDVAQKEKREGDRPAYEGGIPDFESYERVFVGFRTGGAICR